jgi:hypothetical protein
MKLSVLTDEDRELLKGLVAYGPRREIAPSIRGRLALHNLIDETPQGWAITERGKSTLLKMSAVGSSLGARHRARVTPR